LAPVQTSQGHNRYSYVLNQPLALTDPSGFAPPGQRNPPGPDESGASCNLTASSVKAGYCAGMPAGATSTDSNGWPCFPKGVGVGPGEVLGPFDPPPPPPPPPSTDSGGKGPMVAPAGSLEARPNQAVARHIEAASDMTNLDPLGNPVGSGGLTS